MSSPDIVFARIDNRLVHGQVGASWLGAVKANLIVVADDTVAQDEVQQAIMKMTADSAGVGIRFFSLDKTIEIIGKASPQQHIFLICRTPAAMRKLVEAGVPVPAVNVGNMHPVEGKHALKEQHVHVDDQDIEDLRAIQARGLEVYIQIAPASGKITNLGL